MCEMASAILINFGDDLITTVFRYVLCPCKVTTFGLCPVLTYLVVDIFIHQSIYCEFLSIPSTLIHVDKLISEEITLFVTCHHLMQSLCA